MMMFLLCAFANAAPSPEDTGRDLVITGKVQKPEITVVIARENLNRDYQLQLRESFLDRIAEAVEKPPF